MPSNEGAKHGKSPEPIKAILEYLIETYAVELRLPTEESDLLSYFASKGIPRATTRNMLRGAHRPLKKTCTKLAEIFAHIHPRLAWQWFHAPSKDEFIEYLKANTEFVTFNVPHLEKKTGKLKTWLAGTYVTYRYGFGASSTNEVIREVLYIWQSSSVMRFRMAFRERDAELDQPPSEFEGQVLPVGESLLLVGLSFDREGRDRGCCLVLRDDAKKDCVIGIVSSTRQKQDFSPCAACIVLVRSQVDPALQDMAAFFQKVTSIDTFDEIIVKDFGKRNENHLKAFLDNRPLGTAKEPEIKRIEGERSAADPVLRLDLGRFDREMEGILKDVLDDPSIEAPFKGG